MEDSRRTKWFGKECELHCFRQHQQAELAEDAEVVRRVDEDRLHRAVRGLAGRTPAVHVVEPPVADPGRKRYSRNGVYPPPNLPRPSPAGPLGEGKGDWSSRIAGHPPATGSSPGVGFRGAEGLMTANRHFKRRVRERARRTGESYTAALRHLRQRTAE